jgi:hypothetical protein
VEAAAQGTVEPIPGFGAGEQILLVGGKTFVQSGYSVSIINDTVQPIK